MIHYHGLPITGDSDPIRAMAGKHCMVSFANPEQIADAAELCQSFSIDNGAFTAWTQQKAYDFDGYVDFVALWHKHPACDFWLMPDVIDGEEDENRRLVQQWNIYRGGVPIWHLHESLDWLDELAANFSMVAMGSSGQYAEVGDSRWWGRMAEAMGVVCDGDGFPRARLHGLRMLDPTVFSHLPLSSADSTNVARNCGIDKAWNGPYAPKTRRMRALVMMERIEAHASASRWNFKTAGIQKNLELFG